MTGYQEFIWIQWQYWRIRRKGEGHTIHNCVRIALSFRVLFLTCSDKAKPASRSRRRLNLSGKPTPSQINTDSECDTGGGGRGNFEVGASSSLSLEGNNIDVDKKSKMSVKRRNESGSRVSTRAFSSSRKSVSMTPSPLKRELAISDHHAPPKVTKSPWAGFFYDWGYILGNWDKIAVSFYWRGMYGYSCRWKILVLHITLVTAYWFSFFN